MTVQHLRGDTDVFHENDNWIGYVLVFLSGICGCFENHAVGRFVKDVSPLILVFWLGIAGTLVSLIMILAIEEPILQQSPLCLGLLLGHAVGTTQKAFVFFYALQYLSPSVVAMVNSSELVILLVLQYTIMKEINPGNGNWVEIVGAMLCFVAIMAVPLSHIISQRSACSHAEASKVTNHKMTK